MQPPLPPGIVSIPTQTAGSGTAQSRLPAASKRASVVPPIQNGLPLGEGQGFDQPSA